MNSNADVFVVFYLMCYYDRLSAEQEALINSELDTLGFKLIRVKLP